jgi:hypothetical protein
LIEAQRPFVGIKRHIITQWQRQVAIAVTGGEIGPDRNAAFLGKIQGQIPDILFIPAVGEGAEDEPRHLIEAATAFEVVEQSV